MTKSYADDSTDEAANFDAWFILNVRRLTTEEMTKAIEDFSKEGEVNETN